MIKNYLENIWPEWEIVKELGSGTYGKVYEVVRREQQFENHAAVKIITIPSQKSEIDSLRSEGLSEDATRTYLREVVNDFVSEIQLMEAFKGIQNIVSVEDYKVIERDDEIGWRIFIRMELLTPFNNYISDKNITGEEVIKLGCDICTALEICAKQKVIHRDIKPENIFINAYGDYKLGDFGIARKLENVTGGLSQKGTYNYMAPEVERSDNYDATVDLYSLGLILYRLTNKNRLPFLETEKQLLNPNERMSAVRRRLDGEALPVPCEASPAMAEVILRACSPDPKDRFSSATEMKQALQSIANGTYEVSDNDLNKTVSVRKAQQENLGIGTFGDEKKSNIAQIVAGILGIIIVAVIVFAAVSYLKAPADDKVDEVTSETEEQKTEPEAEKKVKADAESESDAESDAELEQISAIIENAEKLALKDDYEGAIDIIDTGLITYPDSKELLEKKETYYAEAKKLQKSKEEEPEINEAENEMYQAESPFYGIWCAASKNLEKAQSSAESMLRQGFDAQLFVTTDWDNLNSEKWYVVSAGVYLSKEDANENLPSVQKVYSKAYVKYSGNYLGDGYDYGDYDYDDYDYDDYDYYDELPLEEPEINAHPSFYGIWCGASKKQTQAQKSADTLSKKGFDAQVFVTTDWDNLNSEKWYVVSAGVYSSKEEAKAALPSVQKVYSKAYVKYSGDWQGEE